MSAFVIYDAENLEYLLQPLGYVCLAALLLALLACIFFFTGKSGKNRMGTRELMFCAMAIALSTATSFIKFANLPFGGSVTLFSMLFVSLTGYFYGPKTGLTAGVAYGVLQLLFNPYVLFPMQLVMDYILAFGALGLSGLFAGAKRGLLKGYLIGIFGRYVFTVLSGWIFFAEYAWEGWHPLPYSLVYNGIYIFAEGALTCTVILVPAVSSGLAAVKKMALS